MASYGTVHAELAWYEVRDALLGENKTKQDVKRALELASACEHPDARWLTRVFIRKNVRTREVASAVFLSLREVDDARALCFGTLLSDAFDEGLLRRSAELGYAFAQADMAKRTVGEERFKWAQRAALHRERDGFYMLAYCFERGHGCERDVEKAKENWMSAAKLDHIFSLVYFGVTMKETDPERWKLLCRAAVRGDREALLKSFPKVVSSLFEKKDPSFAPAVFAIGCVLRDHVDFKKKKMLAQRSVFDSHIGPANQAIEFFTLQCRAAREAVDLWTLIALRVGNSFLNRDVRRKIGHMIWDARDQANYLMMEQMIV